MASPYCLRGVLDTRAGTLVLCNVPTSGLAVKRRPGTHRHGGKEPAAIPGPGRSPRSPTPRGGPACRRSPTSTKELPGFRVELTEELGGSVTAGGKLGARGSVIPIA